MISIPISTTDLEDLIDAEDANWLTEMQAERDDIAAGNIPTKFASHWGKIKTVYSKLQNSKCGFCEKELEDAIETDVEHFRPKKKVKRWTVPADLKKKGIAPNQPTASEDGYAILAYHHRNYLASCKVCNTIQKANYFPIKGNRDISEEEPVNLLSEEPFLIFPIGDFDDAPESLIEFHGVVPQPLATLTGFPLERALVTISLFQLHNPKKRKVLFLQRARVIVNLFALLQFQARGFPDGDRVIDRMLSAKSPHTRCAVCFKELYHSDHAEAEALAMAAEAFLDSTSP